MAQLCELKICSTKLSLSHGFGPYFFGVWAMARKTLWAMAQDPIFSEFKPWLKPSKKVVLSHGSIPIIDGCWAMARNLLFYALSHGSETPFQGGLSHGSDPPEIGFLNHGSSTHKNEVWALAQASLKS